MFPSNGNRCWSDHKFLSGGAMTASLQHCSLSRAYSQIMETHVKRGSYDCHNPLQKSPERQQQKFVSQETQDLVE